MRKLLIIATGAALLAAPAFAQDMSAPSGAGATGSAQSSGPNGQGSGAGGQTANPGDAGAPGATGPMPDAGMSTGSLRNGAMTNGSDASGAMSGGSRMSGQDAAAGNVQVVSNGPVPDTAANRARYRPLSQAGRRSKSGGN